MTLCSLVLIVPRPGGRVRTSFMFPPPVAARPGGGSVYWLFILSCDSLLNADWLERRATLDQSPPLTYTQTLAAARFVA